MFRIFYRENIQIGESVKFFIKCPSFFIKSALVEISITIKIPIKKCFLFYLSLYLCLKTGRLLLLKPIQNLKFFDVKCFTAYAYLKGIVGAVVIFDHGRKFGIIVLVSDHQEHKKLIASKKKFLTIE